jgi:uncharacterized membrane protein YhaH (DUF805 family)
MMKSTGTTGKPWLQARAFFTVSGHDQAGRLERLSPADEPEQAMPLIDAMTKLHGRSTRRMFLLANVAIIIIALVAYSIAGLAFYIVNGTAFWDVEASPDTPSWAATSISIVILLAIVYPSLTSTVRRLHDFALSGWWGTPMLLPYVAVPLLDYFEIGFDDARHTTAGLLIIGIMLVPTLVLALIPGTVGGNRYGADPRDRTKETGTALFFAALTKLHGRTTRGMFMVATGVIIATPTVIIGSMTWLMIAYFFYADRTGTSSSAFPGFAAVSYAGSVLSVALLYPTLTSTIRRLHDFGASAWWSAPIMALTAAPLVVKALEITRFKLLSISLSTWTIYAWLIAVLILALIPGTKGANRYGPDPRDQTAVPGPTPVSA